MRRRLLTAMLLVAVIAVTGFGIPLAVSVRDRNYDEALLSLSEEAATAAVAVPGSFARDNDLPEIPDPLDDIDVALYDTSGTRLLGEGPPSATPAVRSVLDTGAASRDRNALEVVVPVSDNEIVVGAIRTSQPEQVVIYRTVRAWAAMAALAGAVLAVTGLVASRRSRTLARPLADLHEDATTIGSGGEILHRKATGITEIDAVQATLARASTRLNDAMARERALSADLAHQMRTPLSSLRLRLETEPTPATGAPNPLVGDALRDVERLEQTIRDVLELARDADHDREPHALSTILRDIATSWQPQTASTFRRLVSDIEPSLPWVDASPQAIRQILDVLIDNALVHGDGDVELTAKRVGAGAVISVRDHGAVTIDPDQVFLRRNTDAAGTGIGLALARRLSEAESLRLLIADPGPGVEIHLVFGRLVGPDIDVEVPGSFS
ncbi:MAG: HAMP domain-containing sensor histidine kinase [Acidimicrobiales bacterium]|nr:HAMP domain-containing sensor histidine kinase [Acidimicrobiales bacterium]